MWSISDLRNLFCLVKDLIFKLNRKVKFAERPGKMSCNSKSKAKFKLIKEAVGWLKSQSHLVD